MKNDFKKWWRVERPFFWSSQIKICWCWGGTCSPCPLPFLYSLFCITFALLGATVGLISLAACEPGRIHIILRPSSWYIHDGQIFKPRKVSNAVESGRTKQLWDTGGETWGKPVLCLLTRRFRPAQQGATLRGGRQLQQSDLSAHCRPTVLNSSRW